MSKHRRNKIPFCGSERRFFELVRKLHIPETRLADARQEFAIANILRENVEKHLKKWLYIERANYYTYRKPVKSY